MQSVNRKLRILIILILVIIELTSLFLTFKSFSNKNNELDEVKLKSSRKDSDMFAIMIEQEDGEYLPSEDNVWPTSEYQYNDEKSGCMDSTGIIVENVLNYNDGSLILKTNKTIFCYLYFDIIPPDITITINSSDGLVPTTELYTKSIDCAGTGSATYSDKYQRLEFSSISTPAKCTLTYTKDTSTYQTLKSVVEANAETNANGYRYSGKTPSNYVWFNNELWRIIGSIPTCTSSECGTSENLVKIIRNETIGGLAYDAKSSSYTGAWGSNTLYTHLNTHYYATSKENLNGQSSAGCFGYKASAKANCDYTETGIQSTSYYGQMVKNVYWNTGASDYRVAAGTAYTNEIATQTVSGYIGLMNASDYGYAASSSYHSKNLSSYNTLAITSTNWLYNGEDEWTSTQYTTATFALDLSSSGQTTKLDFSYAGKAVRPVLYLDAGVYVISGLGTSSAPYIIGM